MQYVGTYYLYEREGLYKLNFVHQGYHKHTPWLKSRKLCFKWVADFWAY